MRHGCQGLARSHAAIKVCEAGSFVRAGTLFVSRRCLGCGRRSMTHRSSGDARHACFEELQRRGSLVEHGHWLRFDWDGGQL